MFVRMWRASVVLSILIVVLATFGLASCQAQKQTPMGTSAVTAAIATRSQISPGAAEQTQTPADVYPVPESSGSLRASELKGTGQSAYPFPNSQPVPLSPEAGSSTTPVGQPGSGSNPYPAPGNLPTTVYNPYPAPGQMTLSPTAPVNASFPPSGTSTPTLAPGAAGPIPGSSSPTAVFPPTFQPGVTSTPPAATSTPTPTADPQFHPTDPEEVQLVSGKVQMVEFFAYWCGTCREMAPMIHELGKQYGQRMNFIYLDIDNPQTVELQRQLGYRIGREGVQPYFYLLDSQGKILRKWIGVVPVEELRASFEAALQQP